MVKDRQFLTPNNYEIEIAEVCVSVTTCNYWLNWLLACQPSVPTTPHDTPRQAMTGHDKSNKLERLSLADLITMSHNRR